MKPGGAWPRAKGRDCSERRSVHRDAAEARWPAARGPAPVASSGNRSPASGGCALAADARRATGGGRPDSPAASSRALATEPAIVPQVSNRRERRFIDGGARAIDRRVAAAATSGALRQLSRRPAPFPSSRRRSGAAISQPIASSWLRAGGPQCKRWRRARGASRIAPPRRSISVPRGAAGPAHSGHQGAAEVRWTMDLSAMAWRLLC